MIDLQKLVDIMNVKLKELSENYAFRIFSDGDKYIDPYLYQNEVKNAYIQGVSSIINSSIVPVESVLVETITTSTEIIVPIDGNAVTINEEDGSITFEAQTWSEYISPIKEVLTAYASNTYKDPIELDEQTFVVTYTVSQPRTGHIAQRDGVGLSIPFTLITNYAVVQNGINSRDVELTFEGKKVPFTQLTFVRSPVMDSGAFSNSNGVAKNYMAVSAMQISVSVPALSDSNITSEHFDFLLTGEPKIYTVTLTLPNKPNNLTQSYQMYFGDCNIAVRELDNVGQSITLVEALTLPTEV